MEIYRSQLTGKTYQVATWTQPLANINSGVTERDYRQVVGVINGRETLRDTPISVDRLHHAHISMMVSIERFLDGQHNITHYAGFPEIAAAKAG